MSGLLMSVLVATPFSSAPVNQQLSALLQPLPALRSLRDPFHRMRRPADSEMGTDCGASAAVPGYQLVGTVSHAHYQLAILRYRQQLIVLREGQPAQSLVARHIDNHSIVLQQLAGDCGPAPAITLELVNE